MLVDLLAAGVTTAAITVGDDYCRRRRDRCWVVIRNIGRLIEREGVEHECKAEHNSSNT